MRVRFGYVAMAINLKDCSPSKTVTATNLLKIDDAEVRISKLRRVAEENLDNTLRILKYNASSDIKIYRLTSKLVPLATHPAVSGWDYVEELKDKFKEVGDYIKLNNFRVSTHPDHFTIINSPKQDVVEASIRDLEYHENIYNAMGLGYDAKMVLHIGGLYGDKPGSIARFADNFKTLGDGLKFRMILENDDKIYNAEDVLGICNTIGVPMVLDVHHDRCNRSSTDVENLLADIFATWDGLSLPPKVHISSPKDQKNIRNHADYIDINDFLDFLYKSKKLDRDFDVMIEAKQKNMALHKLMEDIKSCSDIEVINGAEIKI